MMKELSLQHLKRPTLAGNKLTFDIGELSKQVLDSKKHIPVPEVVFTPLAYDKMTSLVRECDKEIAWHALVEKTETGYRVFDVLVYPQRITATTAEAEEDEYNKWIINLSDEQFETVRLQGHSHVNMGVTPSGTDETYYDNLMEQVEDFYIVMILNKRSEYMLRFYDVINNVVFLKVPLILEGHTIQTAWAKEQMDLNIAKPPVYVHQPLTYGGANKPINNYIDQQLYISDESVIDIMGQDGWPVGQAYASFKDLQLQDPLMTATEIAFEVKVPGKKLHHTCFVCYDDSLERVLSAVKWGKGMYNEKISPHAIVKLVDSITELIDNKDYHGSAKQTVFGNTVHVKLIGGKNEPK